jgi:hypothetical protein
LGDDGRAPRTSGGGGSGGGGSGSSGGGAAVGRHELEQYKADAQKELHEFLTKKGVNVATDARGYRVHVSLVIPKNRKGGGDPSKPSYTVTYTGPEGEFLQMKSDVLTAIKSTSKRGSSASGGLGKLPFQPSRSREEIVLAAQQRYDTRMAQSSLPLEVGSVRVLSFGDVDYTNHLFHGPHDIFPVGYRAEITARCSKRFERAKGLAEGCEVELLCEVAEKDGLPVFQLAIKDTEHAVTAYSESAAWRKVCTLSPSPSHPGLAPHMCASRHGPLLPVPRCPVSQLDPGNDIHCTPSFFSLDVELLIEGMPGADLCGEYKYHEERGYKVEYTTSQEAYAAKLEYQSKGGRDRRRERRKLTDEEVKRAGEHQKRMAEDEKDVSRRTAQAERERREDEKAEQKRRREEALLQKQTERERKRAEDAMDKEERKLLRKNRRMEEKEKVQFRRDFAHELKRVRGEAALSVLAAFDLEERAVEQAAAGGGSSSGSPGGGPGGAGDEGAAEALGEHGSLEAYLRALPSCDESFLAERLVGGAGPVAAPAASPTTPRAGPGDPAFPPPAAGPAAAVAAAVPVAGRPHWDDVFQTANCLYAFREMLTLQVM